jgi:hypothetical protein
MPIDNEKIMEKLLLFHSEFTEFRGEMKARIQNVEDDIEDARKWENYKIFMVLPISAALHTVAAKIGLIKV